MNKLYNYKIYRKDKIDFDNLTSTRDKAYVGSGYVIAESIKLAKEELRKSFDLDSGIYILNFDFDKRFHGIYYYQDDNNPNVFLGHIFVEDELARIVKKE